MSTSIASDAPLRSPVAEAPHPAAHQTQPATVEAKESSSVSEPPRYTSPVVKVDSGTGLALLVVRDGDTGKEVEQYPSRHVVEEYKRNIPTAIDQTQTAIKAQAAEDVKAPPAPVAAAPSAPAAHAAPAPSGGSVKI
ncbi:hypothetical protein [Magnetospirillum sp. ME-1]|uniref:hypothetical protein n=1 Tax=Magnetospirillum sp. ME-1 TaxID=1639348 RepID=UPI0011AE51CA|nr:hypothetical protein [Magnetospirillum sp. ME-1]